MKPWEIMQSGQLLEGIYDKAVILKGLADLPPSQFSGFCREYLHLLHWYESNKGTWVTDHKQLIDPKYFFQLKEIDFDTPPPIKVE